MVDPCLGDANTQNENQILHPLFLRVSRHEEKAIKKKCHVSFRALRSATAATGGSCKPLKRLDLNFNGRAKTLIMACAHSCVLSFASAYISAGTVPLALLLVSISSAA